MKAAWQGGELPLDSRRLAIMVMEQRALIQRQEAKIHGLESRRGPAHRSGDTNTRLIEMRRWVQQLESTIQMLLDQLARSDQYVAQVRQTAAARSELRHLAPLRSHLVRPLRRDAQTAKSRPCSYTWRCCS